MKIEHLFLMNSQFIKIIKLFNRFNYYLFFIFKIK